MRRRFISMVALVAYGALLIRLVVFKAIPVIHVGHMVFKLGGTHTGHGNFIPFKTIASMLVGRNHLIAMVNLLGNILPFVPVGVLVPLIFPKTMWWQAVWVAVGVGLAMEGLEVAFRVGVFDVDDILLNALGVVMGYWLFAVTDPERPARAR